MLNNQTASSELRTKLNGTQLNEHKSDEPANDTRTNQNVLTKLKAYLIALRVWSLSASIIPTILGKFIQLYH